MTRRKRHKRVNVTFPTFRSLPYLLLSLLAWVGSLNGNALAQDATNASGTVDGDTISQLIKDLESTSFATRETASEQLQQLGFDYVPELIQRRKDVIDLEARDRLMQAIETIRTDRFAVLSKQFLRSGNEGEFQDLSCWEYFSGLLGTARTSKILFLEMLQTQPKICQLVQDALEVGTEGNPPAQFQALNRELVEQSLRMAERRVNKGLRPEIGDVVAILVGISVLPEQAPVEVNELLEQSAHVIPVSQYLFRRGYKEHIRTLYNDWLPKSHESMAERAIATSMRMGLAKGAVIARKRLDAQFDVRQRQQAIQCVARFGDHGDLLPLSELLDDKTVCREFPSLPLFGRFDESDESPPLVVPAADIRPVTFRNRICDMALAAMMLIADEEITQVFPRFKVNGNPYFDYETAVQVDDESLKERDQQIETFKAKILKSLEQAVPASSGAT